jgi:TatA/E family protein of Tat protein translocase
MGSLGWQEILLLFIIALIIFGPRKLPEIGRSIGQGLAQFRRASEDFKRAWEEEVEMEKRRLELESPISNAIPESVPTSIPDPSQQAKPHDSASEVEERDWT